MQSSFCSQAQLTHEDTVPLWEGPSCLAHSLPYPLNLSPSIFPVCCFLFWPSLIHNVTTYHSVFHHLHWYLSVYLSFSPSSCLSFFVLPSLCLCWPVGMDTERVLEVRSKGWGFARSQAGMRGLVLERIWKSHSAFPRIETEMSHCGPASQTWIKGWPRLCACQWGTSSQRAL